MCYGYMYFDEEAFKKKRALLARGVSKAADEYGRESESDALFCENEKN